MFAYVCIHDAEAYLREAMKAGVQSRCHVQVGPGLKVDANREIHPVIAADEDALRCWLADLNAEGKRKCAHQVASPDDARSCQQFEFAVRSGKATQGEASPGKEESHG